MARLVQAAVLGGLILLSGCGEAPKKEDPQMKEKMKKQMEESKAQMEKMAKERMESDKAKTGGDKADKKDK